jgi:phage tail sheath protein FI
VNNKLLVEETIEMVEDERADSIYVVTTPDKPMGAGDYYDELYTPEEAVYNLEDTEIDSNYTCTYYPWVKYYDNDNNQYIYLPATKDVVRNMAMTDNTTYPWFAPAGIGRGSVDCVRARFITKIGEEDDLYNGRINPVKTFSSEGVKLWGQKNLQVAESQLNRIAVRRLLLRMRKLISIACLNLIFDPNDPTAEKTFLSTVKPIMDNIKANRGISDYRIEVNSTVESRERRELPAKIFFKPYNALEYVVLDFILTPESVSFDSI